MRALPRPVVLFLAIIAFPLSSASLVDVSPTGSAHGEVVSVSGTGTADCTNTGTNATDVCFAVSGTGDSTTTCDRRSACLAASGVGNAAANGRGIGRQECGGGISISIGGNACAQYTISGAGGADGEVLGVSGIGTAGGSIRMSGSNDCDGVKCLALSPSGPAAGYWVAFSPDQEADSSWIATSASGNTRSGLVAASAAGNSYGPIAVSGTGSSLGYCSAAAVSITGDAAACTCPTCIGGVAASGTGDASGASPVSITGNCNAIRCFAVDPTTPQQGYYVAASGQGDASSGLVAVSVFGNATAPYAVSLKDDLCNAVVCVH